MSLKKIAISIGDINGIGIELALKNHHIVKKLSKPTYCIDKKLLKKASKKLNLTIPSDFKIYGKYNDTTIKAGVETKSSGRFSYDSFYTAIDLAKNDEVSAIVTLPINKKAWEKAGVDYVGHTDMLRDVFQKDAIMMLGCSEMFVALFTEHIPLKDVAKYVKTKRLKKFLSDFFISIDKVDEPIAVLGLNPHAGDDGVLGDEEKYIIKAIEKVNKKYGSKFELVVPDVAFTPHIRSKYKYFCAMYHDQGLAPLKALYFDQSINVSLNLPIKRTSVDHGTAYDLAYKNKAISNLSYINAVKEAIL